MLAELKKVRFPVETGFLLAYCIFLPLLEFWKNVTLAGFFLCWIVNRARARDFGGRWTIADTLVAFWIGSAYLAAYFAGLEGRAWGKTGDVLLGALLFWGVLRAHYEERVIRWVLASLVISTLLGLVVGYWNMWSGIGQTGLLQLRSVGHVNHTAIYLAIIFGLSTAWVFAGWPSWSVGLRARATAIAALMFLSLLPTTSRAAVGIGLMLPPLLAMAWWQRWRSLAIVNALAMVVVALGLVLAGAQVVKKHADFSVEGNTLSFRTGIWQSGLAGWERFPLFGVGKDNYGRIAPELIRDWRREAGRPYDEHRYERAPHAHSLYVNTLAERGAVGFAALATALLGALVALLRFRPRVEDSETVWIAWGAAASAWIVTAGIGLVNTTLHHEHGQLTALLMALWLSTLQARRAS
jgi:O-antigen ligase